MAAILVLHGPNLNLLGSREPEIYGSETLDEINDRLQAEAERAGVSLTCLQSNGEQELIEAIHQARDNGTQFIIINPAAFTHTSVALRDALAVISGLGSFGYDCALTAVLQSLDTHSTTH
jgi:3-dehydroquinate dehydratase-2